MTARAVAESESRDRDWHDASLTEVRERLDVESFESAVDRMDSLSENVRAAVHERAQDAFRRLDAQESR